MPAVTTSQIRDLLNVCNEAKRLTALQPPLPSGVTPFGIEMLGAVRDLIAQQGAARVVDVADLLNVAPSNVTTALAGLVELGAVTKNPDASDRRALNLELTELGASWVATYVDGWQSFLAQASTGIDPADIVAAERAIHALRRLVGDLAPAYGSNSAAGVTR
ncbi:MAG: MarR family winged helix-turn-helix transcriptional regulator [Ruaniaceae bacterium]|nr:MarR family winged helix-turn-helix transcriptional regulator [Ruaniaceae bacterium]